MSFFTSSRFVTELTPKDFEPKNPTLLKYKGCAAVLFYCPWCPHCVDTKQSWENFGEIATFMKVFAFDCEKYRTTATQIRSDYPEFIQGYPTIVFYKDDHTTKYSGDRNTNAFMKGCGNFCRKIK